MIKVTDYWAPWCGPCKMMSPIIDELIEKYNIADSNVEIIKVNVDENPEASEKAGIRSIPTILIEKDGKEVNRLIGLQKKASLEELIQSLSN